jgi:hypothetical protein
VRNFFYVCRDEIGVLAGDFAGDFGVDVVKHADLFVGEGNKVVIL